MVASNDTRNRNSTNDEPPYTRYALTHPANLAAIAGAAVASAVSGEPWMMLCAGAAEAVWLLLAPQSPALRERVFDRMWSASRRAEYEARLAKKTAALSYADRSRVEALVAERARIEALAHENPSFATSMVRAELTKLGGLVEDFVDLAASATRSERHLDTIDTAAMQSAWASYAAQIESYPERDPRRAVARKNLDVLRRRGERRADLARGIGTTRGQMDLIENTFRLLADEIVTMASPSELGQRLDDLRIAVDAIRETVSDAEIEEIDLTEEAREERA